MTELQKEFKSLAQEVGSRDSISIPRESIAPRESIITPRDSIASRDSYLPPRESITRESITPKKRDISDVHGNWRNSIQEESFECLSITPKKKEIKLMQEGLKNMMDEVQEKNDMLEDAQDRVDKLEEKVGNTKRENVMLREELKEKYPHCALFPLLSPFPFSFSLSPPSMHFFDFSKERRDLQTRPAS